MQRHLEATHTITLTGSVPTDQSTAAKRRSRDEDFGLVKCVAIDDSLDIESGSCAKKSTKIPTKSSKELRMIAIRQFLDGFTRASVFGPWGCTFGYS